MESEVDLQWQVSNIQISIDLNETELLFYYILVDVKELLIS